jgi:hypothetical protein
MLKINLKKITLKGLFFIVSLLIVVSLIASVTYLVIGSHKQSFVEYMISYYKFFLEFLTLASIIGLVVGLSMYGLKKLYDKIFK